MNFSCYTSSLGFYKYNCDQPGSEDFKRFYEAILGEFESYGVNPTYVAAEGADYTGKFVKFGSRIHNRLLKSEFVDVVSLSIIANPSGSDEPAYDKFASASYGYIDASRELLLCIVINESFVRIETDQYDALLRLQVGLSSWDFGYGFSSDVGKQAEFYILGLDSGRLSEEEYASLCAWYDAPPSVRTALLRDVYPYNILNECQLNLLVHEGVTLRQFAENQPGCNLMRLASHGLYLWKVPNEHVNRIRKSLVDASVFIS